jgi:hypothetical protein
VAGQDSHHELVRRRHFARASLLKRRSAIASVLGFAALFGLAAQHSVKGASSKATQASAVTPARTTTTTFFDQRSDGFAFADGQVGGASVESSPPPVTQTSVS